MTLRGYARGSTACQMGIAADGCRKRYEGKTLMLLTQVHVRSDEAAKSSAIGGS